MKLLFLCMILKKLYVFFTYNSFLLLLNIINMSKLSLQFSKRYFYSPSPKTERRRTNYVKYRFRPPLGALVINQMAMFMNEICRNVSNTHILKQNHQKNCRLPTFNDGLRPKNDQKRAQIDKKKVYLPPWGP